MECSYPRYRRSPIFYGVLYDFVLFVSALCGLIYDSMRHEAIYNENLGLHFVSRCPFRDPAIAVEVLLDAYVYVFVE